MKKIYKYTEQQIKEAYNKGINHMYTLDEFMRKVPLKGDYDDLMNGIYERKVNDNGKN